MTFAQVANALVDLLHDLLRRFTEVEMSLPLPTRRRWFMSTLSELWADDFNGVTLTGSVCK
jgi:hypothetical protein